jgi:hypothetical protein
MRYVQPYGISDPNASYVNGDPSIGRAGSIPPAAAIENPMRELVNIITKCGITPDPNNLTQVVSALQSGQVIYGIDSGSVNHIQVNLPQAPDMLRDGMVIRVLVGFTNTGPTNMVVNGIGPRQVVDRITGADLAAGAIAASAFCEFLYGHGVWILLTTVTSGGGGGGDISIQVQNVLYPYCISNNSANLTVPPNRVVVPMAPWVPAVGDSHITSGFNTSTGQFVCPTGYGGLWILWSYANSLISDTSGYTTTRYCGTRFYTNGTTNLLASAYSGNGGVIHNTVTMFMNMVPGNSIELKVIADDAGNILTHFYFMALRLGRST